MPLDPSISLQVRPPQFEAMDPTKTLLTIAQLQAMQQQAALRDMQMQQARLQLAEYAGVQKTLADYYAGGGGGDGGGGAAQAVRPIGATGGMSQPVMTPATPAPADATAGGLLPASLGPQMPGAMQPQAPMVRPSGMMADDMVNMVRSGGVNLNPNQLDPYGRAGAAALGGAMGPPGQAGPTGIALPVGPVSSLPQWADSPLVKAQQAQYGTGPDMGVPTVVPNAAPTQPATFQYGGGPGLPGQPGPQTAPQPMPQTPQPGVPQAPPQPMPQTPQTPQARPQPPQTPLQGAGMGLPTEAQYQKRQQLYEKLQQVAPNLGSQLVKQWREGDIQDAELKMKLAERQVKNMAVTAEVFSAVNSQADLDEARQLLAQIDPRLAQKIGTRFDDPQTQQQLQFFGRQAQTLQQRAQMDLERDRLAFDKFKQGKEFEFKGEQLKIDWGKLSVDEQKVVQDAIRLNEVEPITIGNEVFLREKYRGAADNLKKLTGVTTAGGGGAPPGTAPSGAGPSGAAPTGGGPSRPGMTYAGPSAAAVEPTQTTIKNQLNVLNDRAQTAAAVHPLLNEAEALIAQGIYPASPALEFVLDKYKKRGGKLLPQDVPDFASWDEPTLARTVALRQLGSRLALTQGKLGGGISDADRETYIQGTGALSQPQTMETLKTIIPSLRRIADHHINEADKANDWALKNPGKPIPYQGSGTGGVGAPGRPSAAERKPPIDAAKFQEIERAEQVRASQAGRPPRSREELLRDLRKNGYDVRAQ